MARAVEKNNHGWDFLEVGKIYQYKEDWFISMVEILENNSTEKEYKFLIKPIQEEGRKLYPPFEVSHNREFSGVYSGMSEFYPEGEKPYMTRVEIKAEVDRLKNIESGSI